MAITYYSMGDELITHNTTDRVLYSAASYADETYDLVKSIRACREPVVIGSMSFVGADILSNAWATFEWLKSRGLEPQWVSKPPDP